MQRMNKIDTIFSLMDSWRHLPSYQLERRADIFFALFIPQALEEKLGFPIRPQLIPEFPARIGTIYPERDSNQSFKIDYLALSQDGRRAVFVELKTDTLSRRVEQDDYLKAAQKAGLSNLLEGLLKIFRATNAKRKYFYLIDQLASMGLYQIPDSMREIMASESLRGVTEASRTAAITSAVSECAIVYIQPIGSGPDIISFDDMKDTVQKHDDEISSRFAASLSEWARIEA
jgi:hypothetical protein